MSSKLILGLGLVLTLCLGVQSHAVDLKVNCLSADGEIKLDPSGLLIDANPVIKRYNSQTWISDTKCYMVQGQSTSDEAFTCLGEDGNRYEFTQDIRHDLEHFLLPTDYPIINVIDASEVTIETFECSPKSGL